MSREPNPHLAALTPGSWDPPFKRWIVGTALALVLLSLGLVNLVEGSATVPMPRKGHTAWVPVEGLPAATWAFAKIGAAVFLNGRYFWRFTDELWPHCETIQNFGATVGVLCAALTYALILIPMFF